MGSGSDVDDDDDRVDKLKTVDLLVQVLDCQGLYTKAEGLYR